MKTEVPYTADRDETGLLNYAEDVNCKKRLAYILRHNLPVDNSEKPFLERITATLRRYTRRESDLINSIYARKDRKVQE